MINRFLADYHTLCRPLVPSLIIRFRFSVLGRQDAYLI